MNHNFNNEVIELEDQNLDELDFYNPDEPNDITPKFIVRIEAEKEGSKPLVFLCQPVTIGRVLLEVPEDIALIIENTRAKTLPDPNDLITHEQLQEVRAMYEYNLTAVRLGLIRPELTEEQLNKLPGQVVRALADAITAFTNEENDNNVSEEPDNKEE